MITNTNEPVALLDTIRYCCDIYNSADYFQTELPHLQTRQYPRVWNLCSDSFTILGLWVLGLAFSHINESYCKLMSPEHSFNDKSAVPLHPEPR